MKFPLLGCCVLLVMAACTSTENGSRPEFTVVTGVSTGALMGSVVYGDMYRIYLAAQRDGLNYHLAYIPEDFDMESQEPFDLAYMRALFELGHKMGKQGYNWSSTPPSFELEAGANQH